MGFVQEFYDWYWNRFADKADDLRFDIRTLPSVETVLKNRPFVLSSKLRLLLSHEERQMKITHEIGNLDFDPFWGNQDAQGKYIVDQVSVTENRCEATILQGTYREGSLVAQLEKNGSKWQFANFRYSYYSEDGKTKQFPDQDLIEILSRKN